MRLVSLWFVAFAAVGAVLPAADPVAELAVLSDANWDQFVPQGKEVDAIVGDVVLRNQHLTAVIAQPLATRHANLTIHDVGGCLLDLTARDSQSDQLGCFFPGRRQFPYRKWVLGGTGGPIEAAEGATLQGRAVTVTVTSEATEKLPEVAVTYALGWDDRHVRVQSVFTNKSQQPLEVTLVDDLRADGGKEDFQRSPNGTGKRFLFADRYWGQAYEIVSPDLDLEANSDARTVTLKYRSAEGRDTRTLQPGESFTLTRLITAGPTAFHVLEAYDRTQGAVHTDVRLAVRDGHGRPLAGAYLDLIQSNALVGTLSTDGRGETRAPIHPGEYAVNVRWNGAMVKSSERLVVQDAIEQQQSLRVDDLIPGLVDAVITDGEGQPVACKIEFVPQGETPRPDLGPETAEFAVKNLRYAPDGLFTQALHPGTYDVTISHGPEYDAVFTTVQVAPGETAKLTAKLPRVVETNGWISSDFHSHSSPSGDNTSSQLGRVLNLLCEHIEFAPCTEHNRIMTYEEPIRRLKIASRLASCSGMELTGLPLPLNHHNVFPLHHHPHRQDGGGPVPAEDPQAQIERLALWDNRGEKLVQQNHPDIGWLFNDKNGDGEPDGGFSGAFGFMDVIEIHPIEAAWNFTKPQQPAKNASNRIFHWVQMLNQGYRIPGVVNTDAHYNYHGSGGLRNWLESPTDEPGKVQVLDTVHAAEHGHIIMSNGPFLNVFAQPTQGEGDTAGGDLAAPDGRVTLSIKVQSPNWIDVDEVFVLINGRLDPAHHFRRAAQANLFRDGVVKFETKLPLELKSDAHLIVVAGAPDKQLGPVQGPSWGKQPPTAISNPIYIDVDGNGFQANKDTLGRPLPVKGGTPE